MNKWIILCLMCVSAQAQAQHNKLLQEYRTKVKAYNQDIKAAGYAASIQQEKEKSAKADFLPSLSGNANFNYTGNPAEQEELYRLDMIRQKKKMNRHVMSRCV